MGSTITTSVAATTIVGRPDGVQYLALWEQTYESNVYPHTPLWSCRFFGTYENAVRAIFRWAGVCEGGLLRSRNGPMRPERYIERWMDAMKSATEQPDALVDVRFGNGIYELAPDKEAAIRAACVAHGLAVAVEADPSGKPVRLRFRLSDLGGCALCSTLSSVGSDGHIATWKMLPGTPTPATPLAPVQVPVADLLGGTADNGWPTEPGPPSAAYKLLASAEGVHSDHLVVHQDGTVVIEWPYSHIEAFAATVAAQAELKAPGTGALLITRFRQQILDAGLAPDSLHLTIVRDPVNCDLPHRAQEAFDRLASLCSSQGVGRIDGAQQELTVTMGELRACDAAHLLRQLQRHQITCAADESAANSAASATSGAVA